MSNRAGSRALSKILDFWVRYSGEPTVESAAPCLKSAADLINALCHPNQLNKGEAPNTITGAESSKQRVERIKHMREALLWLVNEIKDKIEEFFGMINTHHVHGQHGRP